LDVGCAKGYLVRALRDLGVRCFGVDVSEYALSCAPESVRDYLEKVDLDHDRLPFDDKTFDLVVAFRVLDYLHDLSSLIPELRRVTMDNGILYTRTVNVQSPGDVYRANVHTGSFWIKELKRGGFEYLYEDSSFVEEWLVRELREGKSTKARAGRIIDRVPFVGRRLLVDYFRSKAEEEAVSMFFVKTG